MTLSHHYFHDITHVAMYMVAIYVHVKHNVYVHLKHNNSTIVINNIIMAHTNYTVG